jgi:meiotically up-regulated gene 157 (Mug157) protein
MKKESLTCTKGTRKSAIRKTYAFPPIPNLPLIRNIQEAFDYIFIQYKTKVHLEKEIQHWKTMYEITSNTRDVMQTTIKLKDEHIELLKMGDIPPETYVELINKIEAHKTENKKLEKQVKELKEALKKSNRFHYKDFIVN